MSEEIRNVVLLSIDALRADHLSCLGYDRRTSPTIDRIADRNLSFANAYSQSSHTREAIPAILTGQYPDAAVDEEYRLAEETVAERLRSKGFRTAGFHSNPYVSRAYGFAAGFDTFDDDLRLGRHRLVALAQRALDKLRNRHYARAETVNERVLEWLDEHQHEPFFLWNHYMDVHGPYEPSQEYREFGAESVGDKRAQQLYKRAIRDPDEISEQERETLIDLYDAEIRYVDDQIDTFVDALKDRGLLEETLLVLTADHGDAFGEHCYYEHPRYLHDELTRVPLIVAMPGSSTDSVETPASTADVVPTVLSTVGLASDDLPGLVAHRLSDRDDRIVYSQARGEGEDAGIRRFSARNRDGACFMERKIETGEILAESTDQGDGELRSALREHSAVRLGFGDSRDERTVDADESVEDRLEALGYKERE